MKLPERVLSYSWPQIYAAAALFALVIMLGWLILDKGGKLAQVRRRAHADRHGRPGAQHAMELLGKGANVLTRPHHAPAAERRRATSPATAAAPPAGRHAAAPIGTATAATFSVRRGTLRSSRGTGGAPRP